MRLRLKKLVAYALVLAMLLTIMPVSASAAWSSWFSWDRSAQSAPAQEPAAEEAAPAEEEAPAEEPAPEAEPVEEAEPAEEPVEEAEIVYPAIAQELEIDDELTVSIEAEEGAFPEGTAVTAENVEFEDVQKAVDEAENVDGTVLYAVDITFTLDGAELQPAEGKSVKVRFIADELEDKAEDVAIVHIDSETNEAEPIETVDAEESNEVAFEAEKFSVYAVIDDAVNGDARRTIEFYEHPDDETPIATMYVRENDPDSERAKILYDPGVSDEALAGGKIFRGWTTNPNYTSETEILNIEQIRTAAYSGTITEGEPAVKYYAVLFTGYTVIYADEFGNVIHTDTVVTRTETSVDYTISQSYTSPNPNASFVGWKVLLGSVTPKTSGAQEPYPVDTVVTISGDVLLQADAPEGKWLIFDSDGGSYVAPQFIVDREGSAYQRVTEEPDDPVRHGYTFQRWIDDEGNTFEFGSALEAQTTVHAEWEENTTASYAVIIWRQRMSDTIAENFGDNKNYDFVEAVVHTGTVGNTISNVSLTGSNVTDGDGAQYPNAVVDGTERNSAYDEGYIGYHCARMDQNVTIKSDGSSVVNVYYDRNIVTYTFYTTSGTGYTYTQTTSNTVTPQYAFVNGQYVELTQGTGDVYSTTTSNNPAEQYRLLNGEYVPLTRVTQNTYSRAYDADDSPKKYGLVNGQYVPIHRATRDVYNNMGRAIVLDYTEALGAHYGLQNGQYVDLEARGILWYIQGTNTRYQGDHYLKTQEEYWALDSNDAEYTGNFYQVSGTTYSWEYNGQPYTGTRYTKGQGNVWLLNGELYTGTRYVRGTGPSGWGVYSHEVGLYGENLNWPEDTSYWWYEGTAQGSSRMTYKADFLPLDSNMNVSYYGRQQTNATGRIVFLTQNEAMDGYDTAMTVSSSNGNNTFNINDKFAGFYAYQYRTSTTGAWQSVGTLNPDTGFYGSQVNFTNRLEIRYNRKVSDIVYMDGSYFSGKDGSARDDKTPFAEAFDSGTNGKNIPFGADISSYGPGGANQFVPSAFHVGYTFAGWYADSTCTVPYTFGTMPNGNLTLYAKWVRTGYRVFLHANAYIEDDNGGRELDQTLTWGEGQQMNFYVGYEESVQNVVGVRSTGYEFVGWFRDEALRIPFITDNIKMTDDTVPAEPAYNKDVDMTDEMDKFGNIVDPATAYNSDVNRPWVTRKLNLYAKWRKVIIGADGINVEYDVGDSNTPREDQLDYLDGTWVRAQAASVPTDQTMRFLHWDIMNWDDTAGAYVPSGKSVFPGDSFEVKLDNAKAEELPESTATDPKFKYTVQLRAVYTKKNVPTPTHLDWYGNGGKTANDETVVSDPDLQINEASPIRPADTFTRSGYTFIGWAKLPEGELPDENTEPWLAYDADTDTFTTVITTETGSQTKTVTHVAADEVLPYDNMFALWERNAGFTVVYITEDLEEDSQKRYKELSSTEYALADYEDDTFDLVAHTPSGYYYGGYYSEAPDEEDGWSFDASYHDNDAEEIFVDGGSELEPEDGETYYVKAIPTSYMDAYYKYTYIFSKKQITGMWIMTALDDTNFKEAGFAVFPKAGTTLSGNHLFSTSAPVDDFDHIGIRSYVWIQNADGSNEAKVYPKDVVGASKDIGGYLPYLKVENLVDFTKGKPSSDIKFQVVPYWITLDSELVIGDKGFEVTIFSNKKKLASKTEFTVDDTMKTTIDGLFEGGDE